MNSIHTLTVEQEKSARSQNFDADAHDNAIKKLDEQNTQIKDLLSKIENLEKNLYQITTSQCIQERLMLRVK